MNLEQRHAPSEDADIIPYALFLVLCYAFRDPRDVANFLPHSQQDSHRSSA